ncbi:MAG: PDZ domain-containing protein [Nitrospinae bacterium]|nr:PDZ domain-containing protein [Nitrospinota bacterium]
MVGTRPLPCTYLNIALLIFFTIISLAVSNHAWAGQAERPKEVNKVYDYQGADMKSFGSEVNADMSRISNLFGTAAEWEGLLEHQEDLEKKGWLGIAMKLPAKPPKEQGSGAELQAVEVARVMPDSGAEKAGLREGDLIVGVNGKPIEVKDNNVLLSFRITISKIHPGEKVKLRVLRDGSAMEIRAEIKPYPKARTILKPHPDLEKKTSVTGKSLLNGVLEKEGLTGEFARILKEFRNEADKVVSPMLMKNGDYNPFRLQEVNYIMYHPMDLPVVARKITDRLQDTFNKTNHDIAGLIKTGMEELDMTYAPPKPEEAKPPKDMTEYVERLVNAIQHANSERSAVLSVFTDEEIDFLYQTAPKLLVEDYNSEKREKTDAEKRDQETSLLRFFKLVLKMDLPRLLNASAEIARAIDLKTLEKLDKKAGKLEYYPKGWKVHEKDNLTEIDTPAGRVFIGGTGDNVYTEDSALILDFGGNDKYFNHAGGSTRQIPFSVVIDIAGDDLYSTNEDFAHGAGLLGGGFLIALEGKHRYMAKSHSQGVGILGVGVLVDLAGNGQYVSSTFSQGAASFGVGILAEVGGNNSYYGNFFVQGAGYVKGLGALVDVSGNNKYFAGGLYEDFRAPGKSYVSMAQGFGFGLRPSESFLGASGGIGVLFNAEGNNTYVADYFAQGASYWFSLGILDDRKGNDRYISGRYSQGAGIHQSAGILMDGEGGNIFLADFGVAQGCGHDFGVGFLVDNGGNDKYISGVIAQGAGNDNGIGVLSNIGGDDEYHLKEHGQGRGNYEPARDLGSFGFLFHLGGGKNFYSMGGKNNSLGYKTRWGVLLDGN